MPDFSSKQEEQVNPAAGNHAWAANRGICVSEQEAGMKLLRFLERRLPEFSQQSLLHKWIRTGQVRVNGKRAKPFQALSSGDVIRVPPFARDAGGTSPGRAGNADLPRQFPDNTLRLAAATETLLVLFKTAGLPVQPGTGHVDSVVLRLQKAFAGESYVPAPAHRLDRRTSGLLLAGRTHAAQQALHAAFAGTGKLAKEYLAWVHGAWPFEGPVLLGDTLKKNILPGGRETMAAVGKSLTLKVEIPLSVPLDKEFNAFCVSMPLAALSTSKAKAAGFIPAETSKGRNASPGISLVLVRLLTGRTHQIRVQFAARGFSVVGDALYQAPRHDLMLLHAWRVCLPGTWGGTCPEQREELDFTALPEWPEPLMPPVERLFHASGRMDKLCASSLSKD